ncbi:hypothetical protein HRG84_22950 [Flavisolibacter sp. BT320]|nr:hypothetical protein [Flavisolibacter longurius]
MVQDLQQMEVGMVQGVMVLLQEVSVMLDLYSMVVTAEQETIQYQELEAVEQVQLVWVEMQMQESLAWAEQLAEVTVQVAWL